MAIISSKSKVTSIVGLILLSMILSRLVWMQLRSYQLSPTFISQQSINLYRDVQLKGSPLARRLEPFLSPPMPPKGDMPWLASSEAAYTKPYYMLLASFLSQSSNPLFAYIQWHWLNLVLCVLTAQCLTRILTGNWLLAIFVGAVLMSRGAFLARIGSLSEHIPLAFCFTFWFTACVYYMRSRAPLCLLVSFTSCFLATLIEGAFTSLALTFPLFLALTGLGKTSALDKAPNVQKKRPLLKLTSLLNPAESGFLIWARPFASRYLHYGLLSFFAFLLSLYLWQVYAQPERKAFIDQNFWPEISTGSFNYLAYTHAWFIMLSEPVDTHLVTSFLLILAKFWRERRDSPPNCSQEAALFFLTSLTLLISASWLSGFYKLAGLPSVKSLFSSFTVATTELPLGCVLVWVEPIILTLGIIALYQLLSKRSSVYRLGSEAGL